MGGAVLAGAPAAIALAGPTALSAPLCPPGPVRRVGGYAGVAAKRGMLARSPLVDVSLSAAGCHDGASSETETMMRLTASAGSNGVPSCPQTLLLSG
jgi:hypothetical protein